MAETLQVRNLAQDPQNHVQRRLRPGNYQGVILGNGVRMRKRGARATEIAVADLEEHLEILMEGVSGGYLEVKDSSGAVLSAEALAALGGVKVKAAPAAPSAKAKAEPEAAPEAEAEPEADAEPESSDSPAEKVSKPKKSKGLFGGKDKE